ncbi:related to sucrose cleavage protein [Cephalotrichum gorgonifer]|uniref:Related to sucrose cleavage protein n=1 Tax=Cephalotrichum gorgonifer TaxID=2041049 RepID=A0AAE8N508_9PEZI|nr:related to sucrose cleavage protein [Cephalotrichum gorgonifer]
MAPEATSRPWTLRGLVSSAKKLALQSSPAPMGSLFTKTDPAVDGDDCTHDCESCTVKYPRKFDMETKDELYGFVKAWETHLLVATGKSDWVRDVEGEKGSVMEAMGSASGPSNGKLKLSASNMPTPSGLANYDEPTRVLLLPAFTVIDNVTPKRVSTLIEEFINKGPTNSSPLGPFTLPRSLSLPDAQDDGVAPLSSRPCPHQAIILLCSQKTRDARCGQSAPLIRKELERHLRPLGLFRDLDDERPGGVGIYFISHVGGHKYSANVIVYRRRDAFGLDAVERANAGEEELKPKVRSRNDEKGGVVGEEEEGADEGAAQCIWLARVRPEDCENLVKYTVLQGKVVKPESQLRGGFDREKGLLSW